jgi:hypothetical protein
VARALVWLWGWSLLGLDAIWLQVDLLLNSVKDAYQTASGRAILKPIVMPTIGYARVRSTGQDLDVQLEKLEGAGCASALH